MNRKFFNHILLTLLLLVSCVSAFAQVTPQSTVSYDGDHPRYILGGLNVDHIDAYDNEWIASLSGLTVGQMYEIPGPEIAAAVRKYWKQGLFSDVAIEIDSLVGGRAYLHVKLKAQPRISVMRISGVKKSERDEIQQRIGMHDGTYFTQDVIDRTKAIIKKYYEEKGFKNARIDITSQPDVMNDGKVIVMVNIDKRNKVKIHRIYITGVSEKEALGLRRAMKKTKQNTWGNFFRSKKFRPEEYQNDRQALIDRLGEWGFRDGRIVADSVVPYGDDRVDIYINVHRGERYYIRNITWVGNTVYSTEQLQRDLRMQRGDVYNRTMLDERLNQDEDAVGNRYYNNGYVFYQLDPVETNVVGDSVDLEMRISEGTQATLNRVRIAGNDRVYEDVIRRELHTKPGDLFNMDAIKRTVRELANMNQFDPEALQRDLMRNIRRDAETGTVDITYPLVTKGGDQIELSAGWGQTGIIGRVGLKFTNFSIQNLFRRGNKRGGFLPQGDGQTLSISGQTNGRYYQQYSIQFVDPWFGGKRPNQFSVSLYYSKQTDVASGYYNSNYYNNYYNMLYGYGTNSSYYNYTNYYDPDKYIKMYGISIGFGKRLRWPDDHFNFSAELAFTRYSLKSWQYFLVTDGDCNNFNFTLSLSRSSIDHPFFPRSGSDFIASVSFTPPYSLWDGKDYKNLATNYQSASYQREAQEKYRWIEYHKWRMSFRSYTALTSKLKCPVLMTRFEFGILGHYNKYNKSPFETYYMGGDGMSGYSSGYATETIGLRGYDNGSIAGNASSNAYAYTRMTLELRYPFMLEASTSIYGLVFLEAGNAWSDVKSFNPFNLRRSAGVGVRILLPMVGLMGVDWAYGFQKNINGQKAGGSQFHFIIGREF